MEARLLYDRKTAARMLSISVRSLDYLIAAKRLDTRRIGKRCSSRIGPSFSLHKETTTNLQRHSDGLRCQYFRTILFTQSDFTDTTGEKDATCKKAE